MKLPNRFLGWARVVITVVGLTFISWPSSVLAASPTARTTIQRSTNGFVIVTWGPPQAILQSTPFSSGFADVPGASTPHYVDTRLAPARGFRVRLSVTEPTVFLWHDTILRPGQVAVEWSPRDWRLQQTRDFSQWQDSSAPATDWYYPPTPLEPSASSVFAGARFFRIVPTAAAPAAGGPVFSVNYLGYANLVFPVGRATYFSFPLGHPDRSLNTLLPLPPEADGTFLQFYDSAAQGLGPALVFEAGLGGWLDPNGALALRPVGESACVIRAQSSKPGATTVVSTMLGELPQGTLRRTLPPGHSLNGPLVPQRGGITSVHNLQPNDDDLLLLFNPATHDFDTYEFFFGSWLPNEPMVGATDAFFYVNNSGVPLEWVRDFHIN